MSNPFEALAERQMPAPVARRMAAAAARKSSREIEQQNEDAFLAKQYARFKREEKEALLAGPHGEEVRGLFAFLRTMDLDSAPDLLALIENAGWIGEMSRDERHMVFANIARAVARCRERAGLCPYDDGVIGEPPKALHQIRDMMGVR